MIVRRLVSTLRLMVNALLPPVTGRTLPGPRQEGVVRRCLPRQFRLGVAPFLDERGKLQIFFPDCLAIAAPFVLFRLKRQGFSRCTVQAREEGLYVEGLR